MCNKRQVLANVMCWLIGFRLLRFYCTTSGRKIFNIHFIIKNGDIDKLCKQSQWLSMRLN